jgi:hypothetical protein
MKFEIVQDRLRDQVLAPRRVRSEFTEALLAGKTLKLDREDRSKIGGNSQTLRKHGFRLRTGMINADEILVWAEKIEEGKDDNGR